MAGKLNYGKYVTVRLAERQLVELKAIAQDEEQSVSDILRELIENRLGEK